MNEIIDVHTHLGNILYPNGGDIIGRIDIKKKIIFDPITIAQFFLNNTFGLGVIPYNLFKRWIIIAEQERSAIATFENYKKTMVKAGISTSVCLPISPYVTFSDLKKNIAEDSDLIAFTSADFSNIDTLDVQFEKDVNDGAKGLKLHPIIQKISLTDKKTIQVVETFKKHGLPVLFHAGISNYYLGTETNRNIPEYGKIDGARKLISSFPEVNFIVGHAGMFDVDDVIDLLSRFENVWVDTSLQSPGMIKKLINAFGSDRVLFASDWPFGSRVTGIKTVKQACGKNDSLLSKILYQNSKELLKL